MAMTNKQPKFGYLDYDYGLRLPQLVLATRDINMNFSSAREWLAIEHQTAGHACHHHQIIATLLEPRDEQIVKNMEELCNKWLGSNAGIFGVTLNELFEYRTDLTRLFGKQVDCNTSHENFEEAIYPIDCSSEALRVLAEDDLPYDLDELIDWGQAYTEEKRKQLLNKFVGGLSRWELLILGENCD